MRRAELVTAIVLALLSIYLMWKSTALDIGYISGEGPGGGAWPFWLAGVMLVCTGVIAFNWMRQTSPPSQSDEPLLDRYGRRMLFMVGGGILAFIALVNVISMYGAMFVFLIYLSWSRDFRQVDKVYSSERGARKNEQATPVYGRFQGPSGAGSAAG